MSEGQDVDESLDPASGELDAEQREAIAEMTGVDPDEVTEDNVESLVQEVIGEMTAQTDEMASIADVVPRDEDGEVVEDDPNYPEVTKTVPFHVKEDGTRLVEQVTYRVPGNAIELVERLMQAQNKQENMFDLFEEVIVEPEELVERDVFDWYFEHRKSFLNRIFENFCHSAGVDDDFFRTRLGIQMQTPSTSPVDEPSTSSQPSTGSDQASSGTSGGPKSDSTPTSTQGGAKESAVKGGTTT